MVLLEEYDGITVNDGAEPWLTPSRPDIGIRARFGAEIGGLHIAPKKRTIVLRRLTHW